ncbi:MAG: cytochrome c oxidase assembly protein [Planctomycetaceae bacterium]|nr:cytochrome c oxidase assembly protein [Planctomycetaceae bacterium]
MRPACLAVGLLLLAGLWFGPLPHMARQAFFAHMTLHMGVVAVAVPILTMGVAGGRLDPVSKAPRLFSPVLASMAEFVVVWAWHAPALHEAARHNAAGFAAEQGAFLFSGLALWLSAFGGLPRWQPGRTAAGVIGILLTSMHMTLLGALITLAPRPLYAHDSPSAADAALEALCRFPGSFVAADGLSALEDQQLGGAIMLFVGGASYLAGGLWLTAKLVRSHAAQREGRV